jgi:PadR family transcriptional regulator, regulatory protein PadR
MNDLLILATLLDGPQHGYAIKKRTGLIFGRPSMHNNLVYPLLKRFVGNGWVSLREAPGERGQRRQVYSLTPRGRRTLVERLSHYSQAEAGAAAEFHLRAALLGILDRGSRKRVLEARKTLLEQRDEAFARLQRNMDLGRFPAEVVRFLRGQICAEIGWIGRLGRLSARSDHT